MQFRDCVHNTLHIPATLKYFRMEILLFSECTVFICQTTAVQICKLSH